MYCSKTYSELWWCQCNKRGGRRGRGFKSTRRTWKSWEISCWLIIEMKNTTDRWTLDSNTRRGESLNRSNIQCEIREVEKACMSFHILLKCPWARHWTLQLFWTQSGETRVECNRTTSWWWLSCCSTLGLCCWILHVTCVSVRVSMSVFTVGNVTTYHQCFNVVNKYEQN